MRQVVVLVEGQTEEAVVDEVLAPVAWLQDIHLRPIIVRTSATHRGGGHWKHYDLMLRTFLDQPHWSGVGLVVDYYGYPPGAPGGTGELSGEARRLQLVAALSDRYPDPRFHPLVMPHEIEALVLAAIAAGAGDGILPPAALSRLRRQVRQAGGAEKVNTGAERIPSRRLARADPDYSKTVTGPLLIAEAGLEPVLEGCPTFAAWWRGLLDPAAAPAGHRA
ncbi:MAG: DUF4276 family protein [Actinomyces sp.]|uniref:DUF4276 family protein n=1 Tax=Actinomyces sp. TaxID=29317 RepID=UPI0026DD4686|nr:DUF4276 family protein [Actinomyces sp.]MDO4242753.1 DUF4276 family protein [Actinomyces sp.]